MRDIYIKYLISLFFVLIFGIACSNSSGHSFTMVNGHIKGYTQNQKIEDFLPKLMKMFDDPDLEEYDLLIKSDKNKKHSFKFEGLKNKDDLINLIESKLELTIKDLEDDKILVIDERT